MPWEKAPLGNGKDRYLTQRNGVFYYKRRVPTVVALVDDRGPIVNASLKTRDVAQARKLRDAYERADDDFWADLLSSHSAEAVDLARKRHVAAVRKLKAMEFTYRRASSERGEGPRTKFGAPDRTDDPVLALAYEAEAIVEELSKQIPGNVVGPIVADTIKRAQLWMCASLVERLMPHAPADAPAAARGRAFLKRPER